MWPDQVGDIVAATLGFSKYPCFHFIGYLAELYGIETKRLNEQVKRNLERFPDSFRFPLTDEE